jgi:crotonobetainyl-CoA:carnitine CoA-transferase CaiB-like acyl-CoA transferase
MAEAFDDEQLKHREMFQETEHPVEGRIPQLGFPVKFSETPGRIETPPPLLGEHNDEILETLGYSAAERERLRRDGVI